ncbi:hypothetical protein ACFL47_01670 [Candidatus Latescibacterota bacterium]
MTVRIFTVMVAVVLIVRSLIVRFLPQNKQHKFRSLIVTTDVVIEPIRFLLPDYAIGLELAPLMLAIIVLLLGLGLEQLIEGIKHFPYLLR